jgi:predicted DNA-binding transcriptional regulator YafY
MIADKRYPNTFTMAEAFEVSQKTVKRDIQWMKDHWDAPIEYDRERSGYFYSRPVGKFPCVPIVTEADTFALFIASKAIEQYRGTPLQRMLEATFRKLTGQ